MRDTDELGTRMKGYEIGGVERRLDPALPIYARIDGRAFSAFTRTAIRPFDHRLHGAMIYATKQLVQHTHALAAFTQSDEINLLWHTACAPGDDSQPMFGGKVHKLTSVLASLAASAFHLGLHDCYGDAEATELAQQLPHFDARVISLPSQIEAANAMLWRTIDCRKNAVLAAAQAHFSHQQLDRKNQPELREMLAERGVDFETYPEAFKWGTWMRRVTFERPFTIADMANIPAEHRPAPDAPVTRSEVRVMDMPEFVRVKNRREVIFEGAEPQT